MTGSAFQPRQVIPFRAVAESDVPGREVQIRVAVDHGADGAEKVIVWRKRGADGLWQLVDVGQLTNRELAGFAQAMKRTRREPKTLRDGAPALSPYHEA